MISKPILDISVPEKEKVTFECEVSRANAEVTWFKVRNHCCSFGKNKTLKMYSTHLILKMNSSLRMT